MLTDVRYAMGQIGRAIDSGDCTRKDQDALIRAMDALERVEAELLQDQEIRALDREATPTGWAQVD